MGHAIDNAWVVMPCMPLRSWTMPLICAMMGCVTAMLHAVIGMRSVHGYPDFIGTPSTGIRLYWNHGGQHAFIRLALTLCYGMALFLIKKRYIYNAFHGMVDKKWEYRLTFKIRWFLLDQHGGYSKPVETMVTPVNPLRPRQNKHHRVDDMIQSMLLN